MTTQNFIKTGIISVALLLATVLWQPYAVAGSKDDFSEERDISDLNSDGVVDMADLIIFSTNYLEMNWESVDWCYFYDTVLALEKFDGRQTKYYKKRFRLLLNFINDYYSCDDDGGPSLLIVENNVDYPYRIANSTDGSNDYYITGSKVGSVFYYDVNLNIVAEIKGLDVPLGIAVDTKGYILVGNDGRNNIEVYDPATGHLVHVFGNEFGAEIIQMPNAITIGPQGNIFVTDSKKHAVLVFDANYNYLRAIGSAGEGEGELTFPVDTEIVSHNNDGQIEYEVFVADQANHRIQVFDLQGKALDTILPPSEGCGWFGVCELPAFKRLQGLSADSQGRLHAMDVFSASVALFDAESRTYISSYGEFGLLPGQLKLPRDVLTSASNESIITTGNGNRVETFAIPQ